MNPAWIAAIVVVAIVLLVVSGIVWSLIVPIAIAAAIAVVGLFAAGMYFGLTRARRSSERD